MLKYVEVQRLVGMSPAPEHSQVEEKCVNTAGTQVPLPPGVWQSLCDLSSSWKACLSLGIVEQSSFSELPLPMAWQFIWAKGSLCRGAAVAGVLIVPPYKHHSPWEVVCACDTPTLPSRLCLRLLAAPKAICYVFSNNLVLVTASQLDFNLPAKGCIFI